MDRVADCRSIAAQASAQQFLTSSYLADPALPAPDRLNDGNRPTVTRLAESTARGVLRCFVWVRRDL